MSAEHAKEPALSEGHIHIVSNSVPAKQRHPSHEMNAVPLNFTVLYLVLYLHTFQSQYNKKNHSQPTGVQQEFLFAP